MELIKKLDTKRNKSGNLISYGIFLCSYCFQEVERQLGAGKKQKSCGCITNKGENNPFYGKKHTDTSIQKIREANTGKKRTQDQNRKHSERIEGENNPFYGKKHTQETINKQSEIKKEKYNGKNNPFYGKKHTKETREKQSKVKKGKIGELAPNWQNGISFLPYAPEFNKQIKKFILERDNYICQDPNCDGNHKRLHVHHIDYDKKNNNPENLITLCVSCHGKTIGKKKREFYTKYYQNILS